MTDILLEKAPFLFLNEHKNDYKKEAEKIMYTDTDKIPLIKEAFFSKQNIDLIQKQLVMSVYCKSKKRYLIPFQCEKALMVIMKFVYGGCCRYLPTNIPKQIVELNTRVVEEIVYNIISSLDQFVYFVHDRNTDQQVMKHPVNMSSKGTKTSPALIQK